ncbi:MAG: YfhO family protein [Oligoflexia bacterium]|nr:YfhO family protein [Oligoflexia bacterium]
MTKLFFLFSLFSSIIILITFRGFLSTHPLGNDDLAFAYPLRILISTSIQNGQFPLWDHWTNCGFPLGTLLQFTAPTFSPIILILSIFGIYSLKTYLLELIIVYIISFIATYYLLKEYSTNSYISSICAFIYTSTPLIICGITITSDAIYAHEFLPLFLFAIKKILNSKIYGIGLLVFASLMMFIQGHLGTTIFLFQFGFAFCLIEYLINIKSYIHKSNSNVIYEQEITKKLFYFLIAGILFLGIMNYCLLEQYTFFKFDFSKIRSSDGTVFSPFFASLKLESLYTIFFPNYTYYHAKTPDIISPLFIGQISIYFIIYNLILTYKNPRTIFFILFALLILLTSLYSDYWIARLLVDIIPFLESFRWHFHNTILFVMILIILAGQGMYLFLNEHNNNNLKKIISLIIYNLLFIVISTQVYIQPEWTVPFNILYTPQFYILILTNLLILTSILSQTNLCLANKFFQTKLARPINTLHKNLYWPIFLLLLFDFFSVFINIDFFDVIKNLPTAELENRRVDNFPSPNNNRFTSNNFFFNHFNLQYYTKIPAILGYQRLILPEIKNLQNSGNETLFKKTSKIFYSADRNYLPDDNSNTSIKILDLTPNNVSISVNSTKNNHLIVWSSTFTKNWKASLNNQPLQIFPTVDNLISFNVNKGFNIVKFEYAPAYIHLSFAIIFISIILTIFSVVYGIIKTRNLKI